MTTYEIDIIILSYAKNDALKQLTIEAINTLIDSEDPENIHFNILVLETNKELIPYQYEYSNTVYPEEKFGFHRYLNIGIALTNSPFICLCNNDLIFERNWASEILKEMERDSLILSASPYCPKFHAESGFQKYRPPMLGYDSGILIGWCIFLKREIFEIIGSLDEHFEFWYCDRDYGKTLNYYNIKHCLISSSFVTHLSNKSLNTLDEEVKSKLTDFQHLYYDYKWNHKSRPLLAFNTLIFKIKVFARHIFKR